MIDPKQQRLEQLKKARAFMEAGEPDDAWDIIDQILMDDPDDPRALIAAADIHEKSNRLTTCYQFAERAATRAPNIADCWIMFGRALDRIYRLEDAELSYKRALELAKTEGHRITSLMNLGGLYVTMGRWEEAEETSRQALALSPGHWKIRGNLGLACLAQHKWSEGWEHFEAIIGTSSRRRFQYGQEPEWDGSPNQTVIVHGEQGLGDEILFASMMPQIIRDSKKVIIDCDARLAGLFKRSFPEAKVYGTRWATSDSGQKWAPEDCSFDASISSGGLGKFYRQKHEDFPGTPFLRADPERVTMWKALFERKRPAIGIAWTGGVQWTGAKFRKWELEQLMPLYKAVEAHWVSLQYKDASKEIASFNTHKRTQITQYPFGTLTKDYDDTVAMVEALDLVICVPTAILHVAGGLGKECWVFVPKQSPWVLAKDMPWYKSVKVFRQREDGSWPFEEAAKLLSLRYARAA
jgi:hypothetical protein